VDAYPGTSFEGRVDFIWPQIDPMTRTAKVRCKFNNPKGQLFPGMFAHVALGLPMGEQTVIPDTAVLRTGTHNVSFIDRGDGYFTPARSNCDHMSAMNSSQPKRCRRHNEHIDRSDTGGLIAQEAAPGRRRHPWSSHHILGNRGLADLDAELEQLAMDPGPTPERVRGAHLPNQITNLAID
jgi:hypothetical protein